MENPLTQLPSDQRLLRKEVMFLLKWSRPSLWRRERDGLRFVGGYIAVQDLSEWLDHWERRFPAPGRAGVFARREYENAQAPC
jgi:hypothetical protein